MVDRLKEWSSEVIEGTGAQAQVQTEVVLETKIRVEEENEKSMAVTVKARPKAKVKVKVKGRRSPPHMKKYLALSSPTSAKRMNDKTSNTGSNTSNTSNTSTKKKEEVKARIKKELRASRRAAQQGLDPERAKQRAIEKHMKKMKVKERRNDAKDNVAREVGFSQGDVGWMCRRCQFVNCAGNTCGTCGNGRPLISGARSTLTMMSRNGPHVPLSPKRQVKRSKTFAG